MEKEFIPYEQALALKELGFDEPCFGYYNEQGNYIGEEGKINSNCNKLGMYCSYCTAPLYQQAFRWFREKYFLHVPIMVKEGVWYFDKFSTKGYKTYEEAELECLKEMIEIIKNK